MEKLNVLFINYVDPEMKSGSSVRPYKMLNAFKEEGHNVIELVGNQVGKDRVKNVKSILKKIKETKMDLCYIESPTYPIMKHIDRKLIKVLKKKGIPVGYFYRDFYRKFPEQFSKRKDFTGRLKDKYLDFLQWRTDRTLRYCEVVYFPSVEASKLFDYNKKDALPPAGEIKEVSKKEFNFTGIYVGGIVGHYDGEFLLNVFKKLNQIDSRYKLILVCRKNEWETFIHPEKNASWLEVHHASGLELQELYKKASFSLIVPKKQMRYNGFAVSVKLFEYISYNLPVISVDSDAMKRIIEEDGIGYALPDDLDIFTCSIERLRDKVEYERLQNNVEYSINNKNLWKHRVKKIVNDLYKGK